MMVPARGKVRLIGLILGLLLASCTARSGHTQPDGGGTALDRQRAESNSISQDRLNRMGAQPIPSAESLTALVTQDAQRLTDPGKIVYVTLSHLGRQGAPAADLEVYRFGVTKALNSVSTKPAIAVPAPLDPAETLYRVRLEDYALTQADLQKILSVKGAQSNVQKMGNAIVVNGDWLVYALTRPEVYDDIMNLPNFVNALEPQLKPDKSRVLRLEYQPGSSQIVFGKRVLERVPMTLFGDPTAYYWRSYDYAGSLVAGEFIFSLPNGLQAYMLSGFADQHRIDAQAFVATDRARPQDGLTKCADGAARCGYVLNGESCITCHADGMKTNPNHSGASGASASEIAAVMNQDTSRFRRAIEAMGFQETGGEPVQATIRRYLERSNEPDRRSQGSAANPVFDLRGIFTR